MRKFAVAVCTLLLTIICGEEAMAQQRFKAGIVGGLNASQIRRDDVGGYNRLGVQGGLRAVIILADRYDVNIEMLYSQRGSYAKDGCWYNNTGSLHIATQYIEIPVVFSYKDWLHEEDNYYRLQASMGFSYGRLINTRVEASCAHDGFGDFFNEDDVSYTVGVEYFTSPKFSLGMRWSHSLNLLYNREKAPVINGSTDDNPNSLRGYFLSFRGVYLF